MRLLSLVVFLLLLPNVTFSQQPSWEQLLRSWAALDDADLTEESYELLTDLAENKLNINQATREDLERLPFLSNQQIEDLCEYLDYYKPVRSLNELLLITSLDYDTRQLFRCFITVGDTLRSEKLLPSLSTIAADGRHTVLATLKVPTYERKGDRYDYLGYRYRHDIRYQFTYRDKLKFGLTGAQDAGEPFLANKNKWGYDFYSYYFQLRHMNRLEELNLGMYRVQMGMGLVMNTGFHLGKLAALQSLGRSSYVLTAHSSRSSASYLRGAAATLRMADYWHLTAFASYRPLDATLNDNGTVRTITEGTYHRTKTEMSRKDNTHLTDLGARITYKPTLRNAVASVSANVLYSRFSRSLMPYNVNASKKPDTLRYRRYALSGNDFLNASIDYNYTNYRLSFSGETAVSRDGALATIHSLTYRLSEEWTFMLLHRYYDKRYTAYHAYSFSEGGSTQNEHGAYLGATWKPRRSLFFQAYVDYARFPWARYRVSNGSEAFDAMMLARSLLYDNTTLEGRYRFRIRQRDDTGARSILNTYEHRARLRLTHPLLQTQVDAVLVKGPDVSSSGIMVSQQAQWQNSWLQLSANIGWFHTDDYDSRIYQYERSVLYDFSFPMYYGHGLRYMLMARAQWQRFTLSAKVATTNYFDRAVISSGPQQINHSAMTDILLQLRVQL